MKQVFIVLVLFVILASCRKNDSWHYPSVNSRCDVVQYSTKPFTGLSFGNGLEKTYDERTGAIKTVRQMIARVFSDADSVYYSFNYNYNANQIIATINCLKKHFLVVYPDYVPIPIAAEKDEQYTITAILDRRKTRLIKISGTGNPNQNPYPGSAPRSFEMEYQGDRLIKFGNLELVYDSLGNIIRVPKGRSEVTINTILYEYNYNKTAKNQFYFSSGYFIHEYYNLAEICGWIPVQPKNIRTAQNYLWADAQAGESYFKDHVVDAQGFLQSYVDEVWNAKIVNTWQCGSRTSGKSK